ncbi:17986_t:CDS:2, partial [Funneliformis geosporum]
LHLPLFAYAFKQLLLRFVYHSVYFFGLNDVFPSIYLSTRCKAVAIFIKMSAD